MKAITAQTDKTQEPISPTFLKFGIAALTMTMVAAAAIAGTTGDEFEQLYNLLLGWAEGFLARSIAIAASIIGALYGMAKQNPILALIGIVFAVILAIGPSVINGIVSVVI
jgi:conjugal transfer pilus assembly protein TraA